METKWLPPEFGYKGGNRKDAEVYRFEWGMDSVGSARYVLEDERSGEIKVTVTGERVREGMEKARLTVVQYVKTIKGKVTEIDVGEGLVVTYMKGKVEDTATPTNKDREKALQEWGELKVSTGNGVGRRAICARYGAMQEDQ